MPSAPHLHRSTPCAPEPRPPPPWALQPETVTFGQAVCRHDQRWTRSIVFCPPRSHSHSRILTEASSRKTDRHQVPDSFLRLHQGCQTNGHAQPTAVAPGWTTCANPHPEAQHAAHKPLLAALTAKTVTQTAALDHTGSRVRPPARAQRSPPRHPCARGLDRAVCAICGGDGGTNSNMSTGVARSKTRVLVKIIAMHFWQ